jgi:hypothetical protein
LNNLVQPPPQLEDELLEVTTSTTATNCEAEQVYIVAIQADTGAIFELGEAIPLLQLEVKVSVKEFI